MREVNVAIVHRSYETSPNVSHAGLGICAINTSKTLNQNRIVSQVWPLSSADKIEENLNENPGVTHVVIQAPWVPTNDLYKLVTKFNRIQFAVNCHSNVGFLQTEPNAMTRMIDLLELQQATNNIHCSGNTSFFTDWMTNAYQAPCTLLPNLYYLDAHADTHRPLWNGGLLKIGIFGAPRPQKNVMTAVAGAIELAQMLKAQTEIWVNSGRNETHGKTILEACRRAIARNPYCTFKEYPWAFWPEFRRHIGSMNILFQPSYTESFNQVSADGVATGVPSVVGPAIRWAPKYWKCDTDSAHSVAIVGHALLHNPYAQRDGLMALRHHNEWGLTYWEKFLRGRNYNPSSVIEIND